MSWFKKKTPHVYQAAGHVVRCPVCQGNTFWEGRAQLNTAVATFFDLDFLNREVQTLACDGCGHILWFNQPAEKVEVP